MENCVICWDFGNFFNDFIIIQKCKVKTNLNWNNLNLIVIEISFIYKLNLISINYIKWMTISQEYYCYIWNLIMEVNDYIGDYKNNNQYVVIEVGERTVKIYIWMSDHFWMVYVVMECILHFVPQYYFVDWLPANFFCT